MAREDHHGALRALHVRGHEEWPGVELDVATFLAMATDRLGDAALDDVRAGELYLAIACAARVDQAIAAFDEHYLSRLVPILIRSGQDAAAADDAVQTVRVRFLVGSAGRAPRILAYDGRGSLEAWLRVAALRAAMSAQRKHRREVTVHELDDNVDAASCSPELALLRRRFGAEFAIAFRRAFEGLSPRERNLLRHQVIDRLGIDRIAAIYGVHRATSARWVARARDALLVSVRRILRDKLRIGAEELDSLLGGLRSQLEMSLRMFLTPAPGGEARRAGSG